MITSIWTAPGGDAAVAKEIRRQVFVEELGLDESLAWDHTDSYSYHLVLELGGVPVATGRIAYGGVGHAKLGRICVLKKYRRQGIGDGLVKVLDYKASTLGMGKSHVDVAEGLEKFYGRIGYEPSGEAFSAFDRTMIPMEKECNDGTRENCAHQCSCP